MHKTLNTFNHFASFVYSVVARETSVTTDATHLTTIAVGANGPRGIPVISIQMVAISTEIDSDAGI